MNLLPPWAGFSTTFVCFSPSVALKETYGRTAELAAKRAAEAEAAARVLTNAEAEASRVVSELLADFHDARDMEAALSSQASHLFVWSFLPSLISRLCAPHSPVSLSGPIPILFL